MPTITINARTTLTQLHDEYRRCCGYDVDRNAEDARQFLRVCRALLSPQFPSEAEHGGRGGTSRQTIAVETLEKVTAKVEAWLIANDASFASSTGGGGVVYASNEFGFDR